MAQVDFSNAVIEPDGRNVWTYSGYMCLFSNTIVALEGAAVSIVANASYSKVYESKTKVRFLYTGEFTDSGTGFRMGSGVTWRVTGVSFSAGDTYSFEVEITASGS